MPRDLAARKAHTHFMRRALERHGLKLDRGDCERLIISLKLQTGEFLKWSHDKAYRAFYRLKIEDDSYIVLYDFEIDALVTIFHKSWFKLEDGKWVDRVRMTQRKKQHLNRVEYKRRKYEKL